MASTLWIGNIQFGDINVPVKLHTAVVQNRIQFHLLHKTDRVKLRQQMICKFDGAPVPAEEQAKGFQVDERKYILIDQDELEQTEPESSRIINVHEFVKTGEIDPVFMERVYYLEPDASNKSYSALAAALKDMDAQGVCTWVMRKRAYFGALQSAGKTLRLTVLRYTDEIVQPKSLGLESFELSEKEVIIGSELINRLTVKFQPEKYVNEHQKKLRDMIDKKALGQKIALFTPKHHKPTTPGKLLEVLQKSLKKAA
ncbi:MAG TPA: Ku protein [Chitinivibrionales bacterium]|jgi:DNA end-binding protein Ku|nr:Ku protein [Chitinivibrionales bacterium]